MACFFLWLTGILTSAAEAERRDDCLAVADAVPGSKPRPAAVAACSSSSQRRRQQFHAESETVRRMHYVDRWTKLSRPHSTMNRCEQRIAFASTCPMI